MPDQAPDLDLTALRAVAQAAERDVERVPHGPKPMGHGCAGCEQSMADKAALKAFHDKFPPPTVTAMLDVVGLAHDIEYANESRAFDGESRTKLRAALAHLAQVLNDWSPDA